MIAKKVTAGSTTFGSLAREKDISVSNSTFSRNLTKFSTLKCKKKNTVYKLMEKQKEKRFKFTKEVMSW